MTIDETRVEILNRSITMSDCLTKIKKRREEILLLEMTYEYNKNKVMSLKNKIINERMK